MIQRIFDIIYGTCKNVIHLFLSYMAFIGIVWLCNSMNIESINRLIYGESCMYSYEMFMRKLLDMYTIRILMVLAISGFIIVKLIRFGAWIFSEIENSKVLICDNLIEIGLGIIGIYVLLWTASYFTFFIVVPVLMLLQLLCGIMFVFFSRRCRKKKIPSRYFV